METKTISENGTCDVLQQILTEETEQTRFSRIRMILSFISAGLLLVLVIILIIAAVHIENEVSSAVAVLTETASSLNEVTSELKTVDFAALESSYRELAESGTTAMNGISEAIEKIDGLEDMAGETLQSAAETIGLVNSIDIESLNTSIEKLNEILSSLSGFLSLFGNRS